MTPSRATAPVRFSVVIDNYNYGRFLADAIDSCLAQTHLPHEIIVVDDGSTDNSREVLARYVHEPRVRAVLQANQGQAAALQHGMDLATGDWILGLDSDDYYKPNCLEEIARHITPDIDWVYFRATDVDARRNVIGCRPSPSVQLLQGELWRPWILEGGLHTFPPQSFHCYSRGFLSTTRLFPNPRVCLRSAIFPDRYLNLLAAFDCRAVGIAEELGCYRDHSSGESKVAARTFTRIRSKLHQQLLATEVVTEKLRARGIEEVPEFCVYSAYDYWPERLISLVYDPEGHPFPGDSRLALLRKILGTYFRAGRFQFVGFVRAFFQYSLVALTPRRIAWRVYGLPDVRAVLRNLFRRPRKTALGHS